MNFACTTNPRYMKRIVRLMTTGMVLIGAMAFSSQAQVNVNINIGAQPSWGPAGYDVVEYYYLPDIEAYYYVPRQQFIYLSNGNWVFAARLPARYRHYDLYSGYKVVINEPRPYLHYSSHRVQYARYCGWRGKQIVIRDCRDARYYRHKHGHHGHHRYHRHHDCDDDDDDDDDDD